jgi:uncharacterized coiled-coil DUF342 family protein
LEYLDNQLEILKELLETNFSTVSEEDSIVEYLKKLSKDYEKDKLQFDLNKFLTQFGKIEKK